MVTSTHPTHIQKETLAADKLLPGDFAVWMLILIEISTFGLMFIGFSAVRTFERDMFLAGQAVIHPLAGLINTIALLAASGFVAQGVLDNRNNNQQRAAFMLLAGVAMATVYIVVKLWEYWQLGSAGYDLNVNHFFTAYFLLTGFHFLHVVLGMVFLIIMTRKLLRRGYGPGNQIGLESGACYWHMIDLIWVVLFPIVYVIR